MNGPSWWFGVLAAALGVACGASEADDLDETTTDGAVGCEPGTSSPCACADGSMGLQACSAEGDGFSACVCTGDEPVGSTGAPSSGSDSGSDGVASEDGLADSSGSSGDASTSAGEDGSSSSTGAQAGLPEVEILHPGDGEERPVGEPIPFIGMASDPEDGTLQGAALTWASDLEGPIGEGTEFSVALEIAGTHVVTLTAIDAEGNTGQDSIMLVLVSP